MKFNFLDIIVSLFYCVIVITVGIIISRQVNRKKNSKSYFFADNSLPWYLVGSSIIAANISAEQFIGESGSAFAMGITLATYEWIGAVMLIIVAVWFLPVFIRKNILTMPQFLEVRYDHRIKTVLAIFWLLLFILINLTTHIFLGALALRTVFGISLGYAITGVALFAIFLSVGGGLRTIANTDIIQVVFLVLGGLIATWLALDAVSDGKGVLNGFSVLMNKAPEKFHLILSQGDPNYKYMPGIRSIFGGIWIAGIYYFGANQYIIQKALGSKDLREAQRGMVFAGYLKLVIPILVVLPGIAAFVLKADIATPNEAYPWLLDHFVPTGFKGFVLAALIAAIVSSSAAIVNSSATIFSIDIYKFHIDPQISEENLVKVGRITSVLIVVLAAVISSFLTGIPQVFQFIQEYTGLVSPGISALFVLGLFWKKTTARAAWIAVLLTLPVPLILKWVYPDLPFLDNMVISFVIISLQMIVVSLWDNHRKINTSEWELPAGVFRMKDRKFIFFSIILIFILCLMYLIFW